MSEYCVGAWRKRGQREGFTISLFYPTPAGTNNAGLDWRAALQASSLAGSVCLRNDPDGSGGLPSSLIADLQTGVVFEHVVEFYEFRTPSPTPATLEVELDALWEVKMDDALDELQNALEWFGFSGVPEEE